MWQFPEVCPVDCSTCDTLPGSPPSLLPLCHRLHSELLLLYSGDLGNNKVLPLLPEFAERLLIIGLASSLLASRVGKELVGLPMMRQHLLCRHSSSWIKCFGSPAQTGESYSSTGLMKVTYTVPGSTLLGGAVLVWPRSDNEPLIG